MNAVFTILIVLVIIASLLLIVAVLLQNGKGEGLASNFVAGNQTFGVRQTANLLEKISWGLVTFILVISIIASFTSRNSSSEMDIINQIENVATERQPEFPTAPIEQTAPTTEAPETPAN